MPEFTSLGPLGEWGFNPKPVTPEPESEYATETQIPLPKGIQDIPNGTLIYTLLITRRDMSDGVKGLEIEHRVGKNDDGTEEWAQHVDPVMVYKLLLEIAGVLVDTYPALFLMDKLKEELLKARKEKSD